MNKYKNICNLLIIISLFFFKINHAKAQYTDKWISLKYESIRHKPTRFYILKVLDERKDRSRIGLVYGEKQFEKSLKLSGGLAKSLQNYFTKSIVKDTSCYPIILKVKELLIDETINNQRINGKCKIKVTYSFLRDTTEVELTNFQTFTNYSRTLGEYNNYETLLSKVVEKSVIFFGDWMRENYDKNEQLIRSLNLIVKSDHEIDNPEKGDTIFWSPTRKMTWADFTGTAPKMTKYSAQIFNNFEYYAPLKIENGVLHIALRMKVYMLKSSSWTSSTSLSEYSLGHEQLHFDIAKMVVERFKQKAKQILTVDNYDSQLQILFIDMYREMNRLQREYDDDSNHSINIVGQQKWQQIANEELRNSGVR